jgi:hypothetical protein
LKAEKRTRRINVWLTDAEHKLLLDLATKPRLAEWVRELALGQEPMKKVQKSDPELIRQIALLGNNLNQIARKLNQYEPLAKIEILAELKIISDQMERLSR